VLPGVVAVAWTLQNPAITGAILGGRSAKQVEETAPALTFRLTQDEYTQINDFIAANPA
jgi:aryl-alcohol dehydrogenase-like predicted oxidoreductase